MRAEERIRAGLHGLDVQRLKNVPQIIASEQIARAAIFEQIAIALANGILLRMETVGRPLDREDMHVLRKLGIEGFGYFGRFQPSCRIETHDLPESMDARVGPPAGKANRSPRRHSTKC